MMECWRWPLLLAFVAVCSPSANRLAATEVSGLRAGACAIDITPTYFPVSSTPHADNQISEVHDRLYARCLVLDSGETRVAIVVCDNNMIPREVFDTAKTKASAATSIPSRHMLMSATHTHTAVTVAGIFQSRRETRYVPFLIDRIAESVATAASRLEPAQVGWAVGENRDHVHNRRWLMKPGFPLDDPLGLGADKVRMNPPAGHPLLDRPAGPVDPTVSLLSVQARDGRPIALLANYSLHYVGRVPEGTLSADYFGEFVRCLTERIGASHLEPPFVGMLSNGTSADINNIDFRRKRPAREPFAQIQTVAADIAEAAYEAYRSIEYHDAVPLRMEEAEIQLGVRLPPASEVRAAQARLDAVGPGPYHDRSLEYARETVLLADYPPGVSVKLQAIRIGDLGIVSSPCETFAETGLAIKRASPLQPTFVIELANGYNGYLPTPRQHALGGYETWRARSSYLEVDASTEIERTWLRLLERVARQPE